MATRTSERAREPGGNGAATDELKAAVQELVRTAATRATRSVTGRVNATAERLSGYARARQGR